MDDSIVLRQHAVVGESELLGIAGQGVDLLLRHGVFDGFVLIVRWRVVVGHAKNMAGPETPESALPQTIECLR